MLQGCQEVSPQPSLLAEQVQLPQSFFVALLWARSSSSMSFAGVSRPWCNSPAGESRQGQFPSSLCWLLFFWCSPGYGWPFGLQQHTAGSCQAFSKPDIPKSSPQGFFLQERRGLQVPLFLSIGMRKKSFWFSVSMTAHKTLIQPAALVGAGNGSAKTSEQLHSALRRCQPEELQAHCSDAWWDKRNWLTYVASQEVQIHKERDRPRRALSREFCSLHC